MKLHEELILPNFRQKSLNGSYGKFLTASFICQMTDLIQTVEHSAMHFLGFD